MKLFRIFTKFLSLKGKGKEGGWEEEKDGHIYFLNNFV